MRLAHRPWTAREESLLGTLTDAAIGKRLNRTRKAVEGKRRAMGIAAHVAHSRQWSKAELSQLGKISDAKLAAKLGCSRKHVLETRQRREVAASSPQNTPIKFR